VAFYCLKDACLPCQIAENFDLCILCCFHKLVWNFLVEIGIEIAWLHGEFAAGWMI
jgi:hypothetical protein